MEQISILSSQSSRSRVIASSGVFQIELLEHAGEADYPQLIEISKSLAKEYGEKAVLTKLTIHKYFNKSGSLPFIARYRNEIIGYIIGVPLESLSHEPWAQMDKNFGKGNTLYTYAFVIQSEYKGNGYAKMLKRVFLSWAKKRAEIGHITGHVVNGVSARFTGDIRIINRVDNWQGTGKTFEYYRRDMETEGSSPLKNNPPLITRT
ncbi:MAG: GNAT family N-acetyltransferase [Candidatus Marinimicrobia bacterium]|nr:GNAT family N-acetyltransferase [Candidatus Neomarinimicrobiota bacterium]